jgi:hypothetical protein
MTRMLLAVVSLAVWAADRDTAVIDRFIASQESKGNGYESKGNRSVVTGDLNHDGVPDVAVLYTLEGQNGTNNYVQYLAVFIREKGRLMHAAHTPVGGKYYRSIKLTAIRDNVMIFKTFDYAASDPRCCPSIEGTTKYVLSGGVLRESGRAVAVP